MTDFWAIGLDGGGTKVAGVAAKTFSDVSERRAEAGPCNVAAMEPEEAFANACLCIERLGVAPNRISALCIGVAGYSAAEKRRRFTKLLELYVPTAGVEVVPDYLIAHTGALSGGNGVIVIAGTGSIAYGVNPIGESVVVGGYGYLVDDSGTGYGLGRQVLVAATKTFDGVPGCELLTELFHKHTGIRTREGLIESVYGGQLDRLAIAALAPLVTEAATSGDSYAASLLMHTGGSLARLAQSAIVRLFTPSEPVPLAKIGSLWSAGGELNTVFERSLLRSHPTVQFVTAASDSAEGALKRALT